MSLRSPLGRARGLGSAKQGVHHWWLQKLTAITLIPLVVWFMYALLSTIHSDTSIFSLLSSPFHAAALIFLLGVSLFHGTLGIQVVIEDYVNCDFTKVVLLAFFKIVSGFVAVAAILSVIYAHIHSYQPERKIRYDDTIAASQNTSPDVNKVADSEEIQNNVLQEEETVKP